MDRFLSLKYYFAAAPNADFQYTKATLIVGLGLIVIGLVLGYYRKKKMQDPVTKKVIRKHPGTLRTYGILVLILLLVREAGIPFLSMRFLWLILAGFFIFSILKALFTFRKEYRKRYSRAKKQGLVNKYLPKKKK